MTKNNQQAIFENGIKMYFEKRNQEKNSFEEEIQESKGRLVQRKAQILQRLKEMNVANIDEQMTKIENVVKNNVKQKYVEDYSVCVINIDKHLEEILHYIFVESFYHYNLKQLKSEIKQNIKICAEFGKKLDTKFLGEIKEVIVGKSLPISEPR